MRILAIPRRTIMKHSIIILIFLSILTAGCQAPESAPDSETMVLLDEKISAVNVSESNGFGGMNEEILHSFQDKASLRVFERAILTAVRQPGKADISAPEYDVMVEYQPEGEFPAHGIHLWLGSENERSTFMYIGDDAVYLTSPAHTKKLRELILSEKK
jgi:hypothetical protein